MVVGGGDWADDSPPAPFVARTSAAVLEALRESLQQRQLLRPLRQLTVRALLRLGAIQMRLGMRFGTNILWFLCGIQSPHPEMPTPAHFYGLLISMRSWFSSMTKSRA